MSKKLIVTFTDGTTEEYEEKPLDSGSEGFVYRSHNKRSIIKIYKPEKQTSERLQRIEKLLREYNPVRGVPYWQERLAWPEKRAIAYKPAGGALQDCVGFRMPYIAGALTLDYYIYQRAYQRLDKKIRGLLDERITCAFNMACAADRLAHMGLCYADFSERNVMVDPPNGRACLIDCDGLTIPGVIEPMVQGTGWYRAPEIVAGKKKTPSLETDRHALAVLFYCWLLFGHPLMGNDPTRTDESYLGEMARYIELQNDMANQKLKAFHLGTELQALFEQAFVRGLHQPALRPLPRAWALAFARIRDRLIPCHSRSCVWGFFIAQPGVPWQCPVCGKTLRQPFQTFLHLLSPVSLTEQRFDEEVGEIGEHHSIAVCEKRKLYRWHIQRDYSPLPGADGIADQSPYAQFYQDGQGLWHLENLAIPALRYRQPSTGYWQPCRIGELVPLTPQTLIWFGDRNNYLAHVDIYQVRR